MTTDSSGSIPRSKPLHIALWVVQGLLAFAFVGSGLMKVMTPNEQLIAAGMAWVADGPAFLPKFIGLSEFLGALGLILPSATRIMPKLTPIAAALLVVVMLLAALTHVLYADLGHLPPSLVLASLSAFVGWGRGIKAPIAAR